MTFLFHNIISFFDKYHTSFIDCYSSSSFFFSEFKLLLILFNQSIVDNIFISSGLGTSLMLDIIRRSENQNIWTIQSGKSLLFIFYALYFS